MDTLRFELAGLPAGDRSVRYLVNGRDLLASVREVERPYAESEGHPKLAGDYAPLPLYWIHDSPEYFLGNDVAPTRWPGSPWTVLYACASCGEVGCWPLLVTIEVADRLVRWSGFRQQYRAPAGDASKPTATVWEYNALGPFEFDRSSYEAEVRRLVSEIAAPAE